MTHEDARILIVILMIIAALGSVLVVALVFGLATVARAIEEKK